MLTKEYSVSNLMKSSDMRKIIITIAILLIAVPVSAQLVEHAPTPPNVTQSTFGSNPAPSAFSLLDLSRIKWSHSYSVTYFSGGLGSGTVGLLNNSMLYEFSPKLSMALSLGVLHNPGALWGDKQNNDAELLPGFLIDYHPSDNFSLSVAFQRFGGSYYHPFYYYPSYYRRSLFSDW